MQFTVKTDEFRKALLQVSIPSNKHNMLDKIRLDFDNNFCIISNYEDGILIRTKLEIYDSDIPKDYSIIINNFSILFKTTSYLYFVIATIEIQTPNVALLQSGEKKVQLLLSDPNKFSSLQLPRDTFNNIIKYDINLLKQRCKNVKYAVDISNTNFNRIFFLGHYIYATDSKRIAINKSELNDFIFDFSLKPQIIDLICNTLDNVISICLGTKYLLFKDSKNNEIYYPIEDKPTFDFTKLLDKQFKFNFDTNAKLFASSIEFLQIYMSQRADISKRIIAWRNDTLRIVDKGTSIETKIPVSKFFDFTIFFDSNNLLGCLKQFYNNEISISMNSALEAVKITCNNNECIVMPMKCLNDPFVNEEEVAE